MQETLQQSFQSDPLQAILVLVLCFIAYLLLGIVPISVALYLIYFLLTLPLRRSERARLFLDLLEVGLRQGHTPEAAVAGVAGSRDRSFGARFYLVAEHLRGGKRLSEALAAVPRLLPPQVSAMLEAGERMGAVAKVLPACRRVLRDGTSHVRGALNYVLLLVFAVTPAVVIIPLIIGTKVLPKYNEVLGYMSGAPMPAFTRLVFGGFSGFALLQIATILFLWLALLAYLGGPRLRQWLNRLAPGLPDWLALKLPWRRNRAQRDFSSLLGVLLDAGVPEPQAVALAAQGTGNAALRRRSQTAVAALSQGVALPEALKKFEAAGELHWRITNAKHGPGGFARALEGWQEALDAKAFQQEQAAAQVTTTVLVLINGFVVGAIVIAVFIGLINLINGAILW
jgi:type IV pilus assembly protein PilC